MAVVMAGYIIREIDLDNCLRALFIENKCLENIWEKLPALEEMQAIVTRKNVSSQLSMFQMFHAVVTCVSWRFIRKSSRERRFTSDV